MSRRASEADDRGSFVLGPEPTIEYGMVLGTYANGVRSFSTLNEVVLDFLLISPLDYKFDENGNAFDVHLDNRVVARVFMPHAEFNNWINILVERRIARRAQILVTEQDNDDINS